MFKDNLIELRKINNMSQEELASKIGVSRQTLSKYETGDNLVILGDENAGIAILKEEDLLAMMQPAK